MAGLMKDNERTTKLASRQYRARRLMLLAVLTEQLDYVDVTGLLVDPLSCLEYLIQQLRVDQGFWLFRFVRLHSFRLISCHGLANTPRRTALWAPTDQRFLFDKPLLADAPSR